MTASGRKKPLPYPPFVLDRIKRLRRRKGLTQRQVADYMGVTQQTYSEYERGKSVMYIEEFLKLGKLFNVSLDFITGASNIIKEYPKH